MHTHIYIYIRVLYLPIGHREACNNSCELSHSLHTDTVPMHTPNLHDMTCCYCLRQQNAEWTDQYTWALFKALSHMLCIGYGRYPPQSTTDVWLTMISMLTGATCYALFVGHATTLIQSFDTSKRLYREKVSPLSTLLSFKQI